MRWSLALVAIFCLTGVSQALAQAVRECTTTRNADLYQLREHYPVSQCVRQGRQPLPKGNKVYADLSDRKLCDPTGGGFLITVRHIWQDGNFNRWIYFDQRHLKCY
jgi:hypothetical protein